VALGLIFLILFFTFGSVRQTLLILFNVPLAMIGGVLMLALIGLYLSVPASVGFIALLDIAVMNRVVTGRSLQRTARTRSDRARSGLRRSPTSPPTRAHDGHFDRARPGAAAPRYRPGIRDPKAPRLGSGWRRVHLHGTHVGAPPRILRLDRGGFKKASPASTSPGP